MKKSERIAILEEKVAVLERRLDFTPNNSKIKKGKWYSIPSGINCNLVFTTSEAVVNNHITGYGFGASGSKWYAENDSWYIDNHITEANINDVHKALESEARRRGLVRDAVIKSIVSPYGSKETLEGNYHFPRYPSHFNLGRNTILCEGVWAEIIEVDKFAELKEAHRNGAVIQIKRLSHGYWVDVENPSWKPHREYRIRPEEEPKVNNVCKFWDENESEYIIGQLIGIDSDASYPYTTKQGGVFKNAKTITKQEAINLLFGDGEGL